MKIKKRLLELYQAAEQKFEEQFEIKIRDVTYAKIAAYMYKPKDSSSLAVTRILFGMAMLFDIPDERGGAMMERRWGDPKTCHFPLLSCVPPLGMPYMALVYAALWLGAAGIMLGYKYRVTSALFTACYWYLLLAEKSYWNNHSYLFGLVGLLLSFTEAHCYWSVDAYLDPTERRETVPYWNYFVLKYQFFILYFMAGLKKGTVEWLSGYSVQNLSEHWVFEPFKLFLTVPQTDYLVVHWFIFAFDLTVAGWMMCSRSRHLAMILCALFHLMNSRLFTIGMFPWVCLATMPLFYPFDWPKLIIKCVKDEVSAYKAETLKYISKFLNAKECDCDKKEHEVHSDYYTTEEENDKSDFSHEELIDEENYYDDVFITDENDNELINANLLTSSRTVSLSENGNNISENKIIDDNVIEYNNTTISFIIVFVILQAFLPYSHFITKGYNNWTNGLYGYSWDMMVHTWETHSVVVKVVDNNNNAEFFVDPYMFTPNDRWTRHGDMVYQYARCLEKNIIESQNQRSQVSKNLSIYVDVWYSMNGRFVQRMFDPKVDLLRATWSPFTAIPYLMPLLDEALHWRQTLDHLRDQVHSWGDQSDVTFFADFPGYDQEKFIPTEVKNVTLTVMGGEVAFEAEVTELYNGQTHKLVTGNSVMVDSGMFHRVLNIGHTPAFYMYTFYNSSEATGKHTDKLKPKLPIGSELKRRFANMVKFAGLLFKGAIQSIIKFIELQ